MAIKHIYQDNNESNTQKRPLLRQWLKEELKNGNDFYEIPIRIQGLTLSKSKEWIILEEERFIALVHSDSTLGEDLLNLIENLRGSCFGIVIIPHKKGKLGFSLAIDDEYHCHAGCNEDQYNEQPYIWFSNKPTSKEINQNTPRISLENLKMPETSPKISVIDNCNLVTTEAELDLESTAPRKKGAQKRQKSLTNGLVPNE